MSTTLPAAPLEVPLVSRRGRNTRDLTAEGPAAARPLLRKGQAIQSRYDVVVVGCGPAGASAAAASARRGCSVLVIDRKKSVGVPSRSSGYVPQGLRRRAWFDEACILQAVTGFRVVLPGGRSVEITAPGFILDRTRFDKTLTLHAMECGADLANGAVVEIREGRVRYRRWGQEAEVEGRVVIGADGPRSAAGRAIGGRNTALMVAAQAEVGLKRPRAAAEIRCREEVSGGYFWFFPSGRTARVGVGVPPSQAPQLRCLLKDFLSRLHAEGWIYRDGVLGYSGGPAALGGVVDCVQREAIMLAGDAAGCPDPITGSGIYAAVLSGDLAGRTAAEALRRGNLGLLSGYPESLRRTLSSLYREHPFEEILR